MTFDWGSFFVGFACAFILGLGALTFWWIIVRKNPQRLREEMNARLNAVGELLDYYAEERRN